MTNIIASYPDWQACETCEFFEDRLGCKLTWIDVEYDSMQDAIVCEQWKEKE